MTKNRIVLILSIITALLVAMVSAAGVFIKEVYARETLVYAAQGIGQDVVNLVIVAPMLLIASFFVHKRSKVWTLIWAGIILYIAYSYTIYSFAMHFNRFFLLYCSILGLSLYSLIIFFYTYPIEDFSLQKRKTIVVPLSAVYLFILAAMFYFLWMGEIIPATITGTTPQSIIDAGLMVNAVHVLDIAILLPGMIITGIMLLREKPLAGLLAPVFLIFSVFMAIAIAGMMVVMKINGFTEGFGIAYLFGIVAALSAGFTGVILKRLN